MKKNKIKIGTISQSRLWPSIFKTFFLSLAIVANVHFAWLIGPSFAQTGGIIPNGLNVFLDNNGKPLSSGKVYFYQPTTTTPKTTYSDINLTTPNTNPVILDAAGRPNGSKSLFGTGNYRQVVKDKNNNLIWDVTTSAAGSGSGSGTIATGDGDLVGTIKPWAGMTAPNQYMFTYGQEISRTTYSVLFSAITSTQTIFCNSGSPTLTGVGDTTNFWVGMSVEVGCVSGGVSTIISKTSSSVTLAANANLTENVSAIFFPWGRGNGSTTFNLPDFRGLIPLGNNIMGGVASTNISDALFGTALAESSGGKGGNTLGGAYTILTPNLPPYTPTGTNSATTSTTSNFVSDTGGFTSSNAGGGAAGQFTAAGTQTRGAVSAAAATFTGVAQGGTSAPFSILPPSKTVNYIIKVTPDANSATASGVTSLGGMTGSIACGTGITCTGNTISTSASSDDITPNSVAINGCSLGASVLCANGSSLLEGSVSIGANAPLPQFNLNIASVFDGTLNDASALQVASIMYYSGGAGTYTNGWQQFIAPAITSCANANISCGSAPVITVTLGGGLRFLNPTLGGTPAPTLTTNEAIHIDPQTAGATNYAIHTYGVTPSVFETNNFTVGANVAGQSSFINLISAGSGNGVGSYVEFQQGASATNFIGGHSGLFGGAYNANFTINSLAGTIELAPSTGGVFTQSKVVTINTDGSLCNGCATTFGAGAIRSTGTGGLGYATGASAGGSVTQLTSRATTVILNNTTGKITLFSAAGSGTVACFTVTNSTVAITDTISVSQVSGTATDTYNVITKPAAGSFSFCFSDFTGTTSEAPAFQFNVIKGSIT